MTYGLNTSVIEDRTLINTGATSGLQLLLYTGQDEYCDTTQKYQGAGFRMAVHEPITRPVFSYYPSYILLPGYVINVQMKPTVFQRFTENLGLCNSSIYFFQNQKYFKSTCLEMCLYKRVIYYKV